MWEESDLKVTIQLNQYHIVSISNRVTDVRNHHLFLTILNIQARVSHKTPNL